MPHRKRCNSYRSGWLPPTHHGKSLFLSSLVVPAGPSLAAHGSTGILLTFPATRPSRTIPSLKSDIRKTGGGHSEALRSNLGRVLVQISQGHPLSPAAMPVWVGWSPIRPDYGSPRQQPSLGYTPSVMQESRASALGAGRHEPLTERLIRVDVVLMTEYVISYWPIERDNLQRPPVCLVTSPHSRDHFQPFSREMFYLGMGIMVSDEQMWNLNSFTTKK